MKKFKSIAKILKWLSDSESSIPETRWREEAMEDYRFYAGKQDDPEVLQILAEQNRVDAVFNEVKTKVDMLIGMAAQARWDITLLPRGVEDAALAELGSGVFKHFSDKAKFSDLCHDVFTHTAKSGRSFLYFYIDMQNPFKPEIKITRYPGEHVYTDPNSLEYDMSDARYVMVEKWLSEDDFKLYWPEVSHSELSTGRYHDGKLSFFNEAADQYRVVECWYKEQEKRLWFVDPLSGKERNLKYKDFAKYTRQLREGVETENGFFKLETELQAVESWVDIYKYVIFAGENVLEFGDSPYRFKMFPIVQCGAYKDDDDNRWFGVINQMKDPQRAQNTMKRQLLHLLQTLPKGMLMHEAGTILNLEEFENRAADPKFHLELKSGGLQRVKFLTQPQISPIYEHLDRMYSKTMKDVSGIQNELMGVQTTSREPGVSIKARQETGVAVLFLLFDNLRKTRHQAAKVFFSLIQQYTVSKEVIRIEGENGKYLAEINSQMNPQSEGFNDIAALEYDVVIDDSVYTATARQAIAQMLIDYNHNNPGTVPADLMLDYSDVPYTSKQKMLALQQQRAEAQAQEAEHARTVATAELELRQEELKLKKAEVLFKQSARKDNIKVERKEDK